MIENVKHKSSLASRLLIGSGIFLLIVLYVNIRHNYQMNIIDWAVISPGIILFIYALIKKLKEKGSA